MLPELVMGYTPESGVTRDLVVRYGMRIEVCRKAEEAALEQAADLAYSVHMPWSEPEIGRLNYAAVDADFRRMCIEMIEGRIAFAAEHFPAARLVVFTARRIAGRYTSTSAAAPATMSSSLPACASWRALPAGTVCS